jgi:hypothetical protein
MISDAEGGKAKNHRKKDYDKLRPVQGNLNFMCDGQNPYFA